MASCATPERTAAVGLRSSENTTTIHMSRCFGAPTTLAHNHRPRAQRQRGSERERESETVQKQSVSSTSKRDGSRSCTEPVPAGRTDYCSPLQSLPPNPTATRRLPARAAVSAAASAAAAAAARKGGTMVCATSRYGCPFGFCFFLSFFHL